MTTPTDDLTERVAEAIETVLIFSGDLDYAMSSAAVRRLATKAAEAAVSVMHPTPDATPSPTGAEK